MRSCARSLFAEKASLQNVLHSIIVLLTICNAFPVYRAADFLSMRAARQKAGGSAASFVAGRGAASGCLGSFVRSGCRLQPGQSRGFFQAEQVIERTQRSVFFNLIDRHLACINRKFDKAAPAIELMRADFADIFGTAIWTFHYGDHLSVRLSLGEAKRPGLLRIDRLFTIRAADDPSDR